MVEIMANKQTDCLSPVSMTNLVWRRGKPEMET